MLDESSVDSSPINQFRRWFDEAVAAQPPEPNAMALATVDRQGRPSVRMVLLKGISEQGFTFFTNYQSRKGLEIEHSSSVALLFYWGELERQVRIEGAATKCDRATSESYFAKRPRGSQLGAYVSPQSELTSRPELERRYREAETALASSVVPCPHNWGGYIVKPHYFEFWQGRENRLHDRIIYTRQMRGETESWTIGRLAP